MATTEIKDFEGGLSLVETIDDNQFESAFNFSYNTEREIETRKGLGEFSLVPDSATLVDDCNDITDWAVSGDATNLTLDITNEIRGTGALNFDLSAYSTGTSKLTLTAGSTVDISSDNSYIAFWVKFPTSYDTALTSVIVRIGSDSSNYYQWTMTNPTAATATWIKLNFADGTTTGTPDLSAVDFFELDFTTDAGYVGYTDFIVDDIRAYGPNSTKPPTSLMFHKVQSTGERWLIAVAGTNMFLYNDTNSAWEQIDSSLTEFESGSTTNRTRWSARVYKDVVYMANGVDNYRWWDGKVVTQGAGVLGRYLEFANRRMYISGNDTDPELLYYTGTNPANAQTFSNSYGVGAQGEGKINSIKEFGNSFLVMKAKRIYAVDVSTSPETSAPISMQNGGYSHRVTNIVGNGVLYENETGIDNLAYKIASTGSAALETEPFADDVRKLTAEIVPKQFNSNVGHYIQNKNNFYFTFDSNDDYSPDKTLIYSSLVGAWTQHGLPEIYDYVEYENSDGEKLHLASSANGGIIYQIDDGYDDDGTPINYELITKEWDFGDIGTRKEYEYITITGRKSEGNPIDVQIFVDGETVGEAEITDEFLLEQSVSNAVSNEPIGNEALGGGGIETGGTNDLEMFDYLIRIYVYGDGTGQRLQVKMSSDTTPIRWTLNKISVEKDDEVIFSEDYIA